jgi:hypothetical protein
MDYFYWMEDLRNMQLGTQYARDTVEQLGAWGSPFLFGLLWRHSFDFAPPIRKAVMANPTVQASNHNNQLTVAIHSRHTHPKDTGCDIKQEQDGMRNILRQYRKQRETMLGKVNDKSKIPCQMTLLSDRTCTIDSMKEWLNHELGCDSVTAQHEAVDATFREHGPFSGDGFFRDMLMAGLTVRDGMIGSLEPADGHRWRSSSELIEESIAYYRTMHYIQSGRDPKDLPEMILSTVTRDIPTFHGKPLVPQPRTTAVKSEKPIELVAQARTQQAQSVDG